MQEDLCLLLQNSSVYMMENYNMDRLSRVKYYYSAKFFTGHTLWASIILLAGVCRRRLRL